MAKEMNMEALQANLALLDKRAEAINIQAITDGSQDPRMVKLNEALQDELFCQQLIAADSSDEARGLLAGRGVEMTEQSVGMLGQYIARISRQLIDNGGELSEEELESAVGGVFSEATISVGVAPSLFSSVGTAAGGGAAAGTAGCPVVGTIIGAVVVATITAGIIYRKEIAAGAKKLGRWVKSWF